MTYIIFYDSVISHSFLVEANKGWPIQNESKQYKTKELAQIKADELNKRLKKFDK